MKKRGSKLKKFSHENALWLCDEVTRLGEQVETLGDELVDVLRELVEVTVWGDKNEESVFDIFLERDIMNSFEEAMTSASLPTSVKVQVIQCIVILLQNLSRQQSFYFVCSNNHINKMILAELDEDDEELMSNYVSFLKSVCLRLNDESVQFFFSRETSSFPLFDRALRLLANDDRIVRAAARQIVISVVQLQEPNVASFIQRTSSTVFQTIADLMKSQLIRIDDQIRSRDYYSTCGPPATLRYVDDHIEDLLDDAYYLNDWFDVPHKFVAEELHKVLVTSLFQNLLFPSIRQHFTEPAVPPTRNLTEAFALHFMLNWIRVNTVQRIHDTMMEELLGPQNNPIVAILRSTRTRSQLFAVALIAQISSSKLKNEENSPLRKPLSTRSTAVPNNEHWDPVENAKVWAGRKDEASAVVDRESRCNDIFVDAIFASLLTQLRICETTRLNPFLFILNKFCQLYSGSFEDLRRDLEILAEAAQSLLRRRCEKYRHHLDVLYGGTGANSLLTPSSLLCQLMDNSIAEREICTEYDALFARLERDTRQASSLLDAVTDKVGRDTQFLTVPLPCLALISNEVQCVLEGDAKRADCNAGEYFSFQERAFAGLSIVNRPAKDEDELEFIELMLFCTVRIKFFREIYGAVDPALKRMDQFSVRRKPRDDVVGRDLRKQCDVDGVKCEYSPDINDGATVPSPGTAMYLFLDNNDVLLVEPNRDVPDKCQVVFSLQANYTECIISNKQLFKLILQFEGPFSKFKVPLVFRDRAVCQRVAFTIHNQSRQWREYASQFVRSFIFGAI